MTEAYSIAKENNDVEAMTRISRTADNLREYSTDNIISITVLLNSSGATFLGHTATIITNDKNQSIIFSYHPFPDRSPTSEPGEMRVAYLNSMQTKYVLSNKLNEFYLVGSTGYNRTESFDDNLTLEVDSNGGYKSLKKASEIFASPGNYNVLINNCDHQTSEIVRASGMFYDKYIFPNKSFDYTRSYYDHPAIWRLLSEKR